VRNLRKRNTVELERFTAGSYTKGVYAKGQSTTCDLDVNVQPVKPSEMLSLPEGQRTKETIKIFSDEALRSVEQVGSEAADRITYNDKVYEVFSTKNWQFSRIAHWMSLAQRVNTNESTRQL
jgi:hypothetical protein